MINKAALIQRFDLNVKSRFKNKQRLNDIQIQLLFLWPLFSKIKIALTPAKRKRNMSLKIIGSWRIIDIYVMHVIGHENSCNSP
jgi:hypothetical protein